MDKDELWSRKVLEGVTCVLYDSEEALGVDI
jgi:hypothetical protein